MITAAAGPRPFSLVVRHCLATLPDGFADRRRLIDALLALSDLGRDPETEQLSEMLAALDRFSVLQREFDFTRPAAAATP